MEMHLIKRKTIKYMFAFIFILVLQTAICIPEEEKDDCGLDGYEAHCVLDIMEEHIEATAIVNHCHIPLDITFRVIYRYGNGTEQRWQYTFVTTNQNERVLIPGLMLPPAPHALVYLFVRVPQPLFDLHNTSLAAIEASFIAMLTHDEWEEVEFLNEAVVVNTTNDCYPSSKNRDPLLWIVGGAFLGLLAVGAITTGILWCYKKRKIALDELALMSSLETGLPGAQPYQIGTLEQRIDNNNTLKSADRETITQSIEKESSSVETKENGVTKKPSSGFKFGRLKEEPIEDIRERAVKKMGKSVVIGNPVLLDKTSAIKTKFNRIANNANVGKEHLKIESVGDTFQNIHSVKDLDDQQQQTVEETRKPRKITNAISKRIGERNYNASKEFKREIESTFDDKQQQWENHPLESGDEDLTSRSSQGARPKRKSEMTNTEKPTAEQTQEPTPEKGL